MKLSILCVALVAASLASSSHARPYTKDFNPITLPSDEVSMGCLSWRLTVETNNYRNWSVIPQDCVDYVQNYLVAGQYAYDIKGVTMTGISHLNTLSPANDGKDVWIFDLDETLLSNLPYYHRPDVKYGAYPYNRTAFNEWMALGESPAVPGMLSFYLDVQAAGFKIIIMSGYSKKVSKAREDNLRTAGFNGWERIIYKKSGGTTQKFKEKKRTQLVNEGFRIVASVGDQWSDLNGANVGRTLKVPNPMYFIP